MEEDTRSPREGFQLPHMPNLPWKGNDKVNLINLGSQTQICI